MSIKIFAFEQNIYGCHNPVGSNSSVELVPLFIGSY